MDTELLTGKPIEWPLVNQPSHILLLRAQKPEDSVLHAASRGPAGHGRLGSRIHTIKISWYSSFMSVCVAANRESPLYTTN